MTTYAGQFGPEGFFNEAGGTVPTARITVYEIDGTTLASLWADRDRTVPLPNPLPTGVPGGTAGIDDTAHGLFFADPGRYVLRVAVADGDELLTRVVVPTDPSESGGTPREIITGVDNVIPVAYVSTDTAGDFSFIEVAAYGDDGGGEIDLKAGSGPDAAHAFALIFLESFDPAASVRIQAGDGPVQIHITNTGGVSNIGLFGATPVPQSVAIPDATDGPSAIVAINALLAYLRTRGDIAT